MREVPRSVLEAYTAQINGISEEHRRHLAEALERVNWSLSVAEIREQLIAAMNIWCGGSTDMVATITAEFYDGLREMMVGSRMGASPDSCRIPSATEGAARAFVDDLKVGKPVESVKKKCLDRLDYETKAAASSCVMANGVRDKKRVRFARVPSGAETCEFCIMLASRGFVYQNSVLASHAHPNCDCRVVPGWEGCESVEEYDPEAWLVRYLDAYRDKVSKYAFEIERRISLYEREGKGDDAYERHVGSYVRGLSKDGRIDARVGAQPLGKELAAAKRLAEEGHAILFLPESDDQSVKSIDIIMDGVLWELKVPDPPRDEGAGKDPLRYVENNLKKAKKQFNTLHYDESGTRLVRGGPIRVVFDSRGRDGSDDGIRERLAIRKIDRGIDEILFISHSGEIELI